MYLDEDLWKALHIQAANQQTTVSDLVRQALRDRYLGNLNERKKAMQAIVGMRRDRAEFDKPEDYIRSLRRGSGRRAKAMERG